MRKIAKGCGAFMGRSERLYAGKRPIPPLQPMLWTVVGITPGVGAGEGASPLPPYGSHAWGTNRAMLSLPAKPGRFSWEMLAETLQ
ncbi:hypothetical protein MBBA_0384 [Methanoculleus bourgensis]|jgi:hypothetical protein|nr:hypothetical protein MBBA_0384 [Methanoculleus bourgensis]